MSGGRQHYLPQFLLKGFASRVIKPKKPIYTWVYRNDGNVFESSIGNIAVQANYYDVGDDTSTDELITERETEYAELIDKIRVNEKIASSQVELLTEFLAHLVIRTKHLRETFTQPMCYFSEEITDFTSDQKSIGAILADPNIDFKSRLKEHLDRSPATAPLSNSLPELIVSVIKSATEEENNALHMLLSSATTNLFSQLPTALKNAHNLAIADNMSPSAIHNRIKQLNWQVIYSKDSLILGDIGIIFKVKNPETKYSSLLFKKDLLILAFLPISSSQLIVGHTGQQDFNFDFKLLNEITAKKSREFFISSINNPSNIELHNLLGTEADEISEEDIRGMAKSRLPKLD